MVTRRELKSMAKEQLSGQWVTAILALLTQAGILYILSNVSDRIKNNGAGSIFSIINTIVGWILAISITNFFYMISKWKKIRYRDMFADSFIIGKGICVNLLTMLLFIPLIIIEVLIGAFLIISNVDLIAQLKTLPYITSSDYLVQYGMGGLILKLLGIGLLFLIPIFIISIYFEFSMYCVCEDSSRGAWECIKLSFKTMHGNFWRYILLQLSFLGWILLIGAVFILGLSLTLISSVLGVLIIIGAGIGVLFLVPYITVTNINFYNDVRTHDNGEGKTEPDGNDESTTGYEE